MKNFFYSCLIFLFLVFNCSEVVFASTDFDGDFSGSSSGNSYTYYNVYFCISAYYPTANLVRVGGTYSTAITAMSNASVNGTTFTNRSLYLYRNSETGELVYLNGSFVGTTTYAWSVNPVYIPLRYDSAFSGYRIVDTISNSQGSITGTFEGDIILPQQNILEYPPAFPNSTGMSYSTSVTSSSYFSSVNIYSSGVSIPSGYDFALCDVTYNFMLSDRFYLNKGSYVLSFMPGGNAVTSGSFPSSLLATHHAYVTNAFSNSISTVTAVVPYSHNYSSRIYFDFNSSDTSLQNYLSVTMVYFVVEDVPSFNFTITNTFPSPSNLVYLYSCDTNNILNSLNNNNNLLSSAGGANSGLNSQNKIMSGALSDYQRDTDTSAQYSNISDSLFVLDTSIFTQVASTITLFSSVVTGLFNAFGDFSVPLTLMLIVTLISCIIGIIKISSDSS